MSETDLIALVGVVLTAVVVAVQAVHYVLSLANAKALSQLKAQFAVQIGDLKVYMHEHFVTKEELKAQTEQLEKRK